MRLASNRCKRVLSLFRNLAFATFGKLLMDWASGKAKLFAKTFSKKNFNLDVSRVSLLAFPIRTYLKPHNIHVTAKLVKTVITLLEMTKALGYDCIPVVVLKQCEPELSYVLAELLIICPQGISFSWLLEGLICGPCI